MSETHKDGYNAAELTQALDRIEGSNPVIMSVGLSDGSIFQGRVLEVAESERGDDRVFLQNMQMIDPGECQPPDFVTVADLRGLLNDAQTALVALINAREASADVRPLLDRMRETLARTEH